MYCRNVEDFNSVYADLVEFTDLYPKNDPVYSSKVKLDILRCHVTFINTFVRKWPAIAKLAICGKSEGNVIYERINRELLVHTDEKVTGSNYDRKYTYNIQENRRLDPRDLELQQLVKAAGQQRHDNSALKQIYLFKKRHPDYDMDRVLSEQSNYFKLYIERQLAALADKEANNKPIDLTVDESVFEHNLTYYGDRLAELRERAGLTPIIPDKPSPLISPTKAAAISEPDSVEPITPEKTKKRMTSDELEKLRARLNKLRN